MSFDLTKLHVDHGKTSTLTTVITKATSTIDTGHSSQLTTGLESMAYAGPQADEALAVKRDGFAQELKASVEAVNSMYAEGGLSNSQVTAGAVIWTMAKGGKAAIQSYAEKQFKVSNESSSLTAIDNGQLSVSFESAPGLYDYNRPLDGKVVSQLAAGLEDFDNRTVSQMVGMSVEYNIKASRQSAFSEAFFRTCVIAPDVLGAVTTIPLRFVLNRVVHSTEGDPVDFKERRLIEATVDHSILKDDATVLFPEVTGKPENAAFFMDPAKYAPKSIDLSSRTIQTAPLVFGKDFDIIGNGSHTSSQNNGVPTRTDALDPAAGLKSVVLTIGEDALEYQVGDLFGANFSQFAEGHNKDMVMMFTPVLQLSKNTAKRYDGSEATNATLKKIAEEGWVVNFELDITGKLNVATGNINVRQNGVKILEIIDGQGQKVSMKEGAGKGIYDALTAGLELAGYVPNTRLTNSNFRHTGKETNTRFFTERYPVQLGSPVTCPFPHGEERGDEEMKSLIATVRLRNDHNALTKLLSVEATLAQYDQDFLYKDGATQVAEVEGIARHLLQRVKSVRVHLHLPDLVRSVKTSEVLTDLRAQINNVIADTMIRLGRDVGIHQAVEQLTGYETDQIGVVLGTDQVLEHYLWREGDTRVISDKLQATVVSTPDKRMYGKIIAGFSRNVDEANPLNFGTHYWTPEFLSVLPVSRDGAQYKEIQVMPRTRHVVNIPAIAMFEVTGLEEVLQQAGIHQVAVTNLPGDDQSGTPGQGGQGGGETTP